MSGNGERRRERVEAEINRWNGFAKVLRTMDREAFDAVIDTYRRLATENADDTSLAPFEQMMLCITTGQMAKLDRIKARLNQIDQPKPKTQPKENEPK